MTLRRGPGRSALAGARGSPANLQVSLTGKYRARRYGCQIDVGAKLVGVVRASHKTPKHDRKCKGLIGGQYPLSAAFPSPARLAPGLVGNSNPHLRH